MSRAVLLSTGAMTRDPVHELQGFLNGLAERGYAGGLTPEATAVRDDGALDPERPSQMAAVVNQLAS